MDEDDEKNTPKDELALLSNEFLLVLRQPPIADTREITLAVASVLALVAPAGFDEADREQWLTAATVALDGIPAELLRRGVAFAMLNSDHPSNIVKNIMREIGEEWKGWAPEEDRRGKPKYISATGYVYHSSNPEDVKREAERRADWSTYWHCEVDIEKRRAAN